ncbi:MAG: aldehyde dehydrogenase family protein [Carbonactinosporaceae bacterium]
MIVSTDPATVVAREWRTVLHGRPTPAARTYPTEDPCTGKDLAAVPDCGADEVNEAVEAAQRAQPAWAALAPRERAARVRAFAEVLRDHREELATLDAVDGGFPLGVMRADVDAAANLLEIMCDLALDLGGRTIPATAEHLHYTLQRPYGVVARIVPFNHPLFFAASKLAAPLVAGNAVVLKAPDQTPLSALRMAELFDEALPQDLCVVLTGQGGVAGRALVRHPLIRRIGFIGSAATGQLIQREAAETGVKYVSLELGGKNAMVVMPDADPSAAAGAAVAGMNFTATSGQSCGSTSRLLVHEDVAEAVLDALLPQVRRIRVGFPLDEGTDMGPVISNAQLEKAQRAVEAGTRHGARVAAGGGRPAGLPPGGYFLEPTVLVDVAPDNPVARQEVFGPVLAVTTFQDEEEAVRLANAVDYGLTASIWTKDVTRAHRMAGRLDAGYIWINGTSRHFWGVPFGGVKSSGVGREESLEELISYTETKAVSVVLA